MTGICGYAVMAMMMPAL